MRVAGKTIASLLCAALYVGAVFGQSATVLPVAVPGGTVVDLGTGPQSVSVISGNPLFFTGSGSSACPGSVTTETLIQSSPGSGFPFWTSSHVCVTVSGASAPTAKVVPKLLSIGSGSPTLLTLPATVAATTVVDLGAGPLTVRTLRGNAKVFTGSGTSACPSSLTSQPWAATAPGSDLALWTTSHVCVTVDAGPSAQVLPSLLAIGSSGGGGTPGGTNGQIQFNNAGSFGGFTMSGDAATNTATGAITLATVNTNTGSFGSATNCTAFTTNGKGLITAASAVTCTPALASVTGLGTGVATALAINVGTAGSVLVNGGVLGAPSSGTIPTTFLTGLLQAAQEPAHTGDVTNTASSLALLLATVNSNVGSFGSSTQCPTFTVNGKGLITAASQTACATGSGNVSNSGTPVAGQLAAWVSATAIQGIPRTAVYVCDIQSQTATTCANGGTAGANNGTFTTPSGLLYLEVELIGGGGPGGGAGGTPTAGTAGGNTCWNTTGAACTSPVFQASGGSVGAAANTGATFASGGAGGVCNVGSGTPVLALPGNAGDNSGLGFALGGHGGMTSGFNGGGPGGIGGVLSPTAGTANTGGGGGGGGGSVGTTSGGGGGGSGCNLWAIISGTLASTYTYQIGAAGTVGSGSTIQGPAGGALGRIVIRGYYN